MNTYQYANIVYRACRRYIWAFFEKKKMSALTLRSISYLNINLWKQMDFNVKGTRQQLKEICSGLGVGASEKNQRKDIF